MQFLRTIDTIGNTPLIYLKKASEMTGCHIFGKAEFMNPGASVKDRAALSIIRTAEAQGILSPGGLIIEATAGNTGIGLTMCANALGYRTRIFIPDNQAQEKKDALHLLGAELVEVAVVPYSNPNQFQHVARRNAEELRHREPGGVLYADQWNNLANRMAHYTTTAPEIMTQTEGQLDGFICACGTGGTLAGVSLYLKEHNPTVKIGCADPMGAALYSYFTRGVIESSGNSITEGIGLGRETPIIADIEVDFAYQIADEEALPTVFDALQYEGLCLGGSSGINIAGAMRLARELGPGKTIVTILCDQGSRYQSKLWNPEFLREKGLPVPPWLHQ